MWHFYFASFYSVNRCNIPSPSVKIHSNGFMWTLLTDKVCLFTGRINVIMSSFNVTYPTSSSFDGWTLITVAKGKNDLGVLLSHCKMVSLTLTFCCTLFLFFLTLSDGIYSFINCFQYILDRLSTTFCLRWLSISFSFISTIPYAFKDSPDIKWFGANKVKSSVSSLIDVKGWLLIVPSI